MIPISKVERGETMIIIIAGVITVLTILLDMGLCKAASKENQYYNKNE